MAVAILAAGALLGAAAGGTVGLTTAGFTGAAIGTSVGAVAGLGIGAAVLTLHRPGYWYPCPPPSPAYFGCPHLPVFFPRHMYFTWA